MASDRSSPPAPVNGAGAEAPAEVLGRCLCGAVRFRVRGPMRPPIACHCSQCRRWHGHLGVYTAAARADIVLEDDGSLRWFVSSERARRGFCGRCGSSLFYELHGRDALSIAAGALEPPTGLRIACHWYVADAADYYTIADDLPRHPGRG